MNTPQDFIGQIVGNCKVVPDSEIPQEAAPVEAKLITNPLRTAWQRRYLNLDVTHPELQEMADKVEAYCSRFFHNRRDGRLLVIGGASGTGKTQTAEGIDRWVRDVAQRCFHEGGHKAGPPRRETQLFPALCDHMSNDEFRHWIDSQNLLGNPTSILFLDDVGREEDKFKTGVGASRLAYILDEFKNRWVVITTNVHEMNWVKTEKNTKGKWDKRVEDRLNRNSVKISLDHVKSYNADRIYKPTE